MIYKGVKNAILTLLILFSINAAFAAVTAWKIVPGASTLTFTGTQNGAPASGEFKKFNGDINFDPNQLDASNINIVIDMGSVSASYQDMAATLTAPDWFNVKLFPQAIFKANSFTKTGDKTYQAKGTLTIRDKTAPVILVFTLDDYSPEKALVKGSTTIKRTTFGVGQGDWASTDNVKDDVTINFIISAIKK